MTREIKFRGKRRTSGRTYLSLFGECSKNEHGELDYFYFY